MINVALAGNPNTGKTTLFNALTGAHGHVGNYPGITVERREGTCVAADGQTWHVLDLPGCYSLSAHSTDEEIAHHALTGRFGPAPDVVVVVLDATNLARNLLLLLQIAELGLPVVAALNMMDAAQKHGLVIDIAGLATALHCPVVPLIARKNVGLPELQAAVSRVFADKSQSQVPMTQWPRAVADAIAQLRPLLQPTGFLPTDRPDTGDLLWWLACAPEVANAKVAHLGDRIVQAVPRNDDLQVDVRRLVTHTRFARIDALLAGVVSHHATQKDERSDKIDRIVLHPALGAGIFLLTMTGLFTTVFVAARPAKLAVDWLVNQTTELIDATLPANLLRDVIVDGVLAGVGGTLAILPQILLLFLGIALLEDSGYLARTAFVVDQLMARVGLPGKAFVPLLSSYACAVPGIMATRTMSDPRDRLLTILVAPLMSCAARLPVYFMVTAAVFGGYPPIIGGLVISAMYGLGFVMALISAFVLRKTVIPGKGAPLLLEMPPYRWPRPRNLARTLWDRARVFVTQTGTVIVALTVVLWALMTFPRQGMAEYQMQIVETNLQNFTAPDTLLRNMAQNEIDQRQQQLHKEHSLAGHLGKFIEPAIAPLGFDWRIGIGLIGSFAAREVLVPVMGQVYGRGKSDISDEYAADVGRTMADAGSLTPLKGISLMVFFAIAMQCLSTVATIKRETNSWRWPIFVIIYLNGLAWLASFAVYQGGRAMGFV